MPVLSFSEKNKEKNKIEVVVNSRFSKIAKVINFTYFHFYPLLIIMTSIHKFKRHVGVMESGSD